MTTPNEPPSYMPQEQVSNDNPAWSDILNAVPEEYHQALTPKLKEWDTNVSNRFQGIHKEYEGFKAFKESGVDPEQINFALGIMNQLESNPQFVYNQLEAHLRAEGLLDGGEEEYEEPSGLEVDDPRFAQLQEGYSTLAEYVLAQREAEENSRMEAEQDQLLDKELSDMKDKYGDYDEDFVLAKMEAGLNTEDAVKSYFEFVDRALKTHSRPNAPRILGSDGSFPGQAQIDPRKLDQKQAKDLVTDYLRAMNSK